MSNTYRTYNGWLAKGRQVKAAERSCARTDGGEALFEKKQTTKSQQYTSCGDPAHSYSGEDHDTFDGLAEWEVRNG